MINTEMQNNSSSSTVSAKKRQIFVQQDAQGTRVNKTNPEAQQQVPTSIRNRSDNSLTVQQNDDQWCFQTTGMVEGDVKTRQRIASTLKLSKVRTDSSSNLANLLSSKQTQEQTNFLSPTPKNNPGSSCIETTKGWLNGAAVLYQKEVLATDEQSDCYENNTNTQTSESPQFRPIDERSDLEDTVLGAKLSKLQKHEKTKLIRKALKERLNVNCWRALGEDSGKDEQLALREDTMSENDSYKLLMQSFCIDLEANDGLSSAFVQKNGEAEREQLGNFTELFSVRDLLGYGVFGVVLMVKNRKTNQKSALKIITKERMSNHAQQILKNESTIMQTLKHPNIVSLKRIYENSKFFIIEMELICGGQLTQLLHLSDQNGKPRPLSDLQASKVMKSLLEGVAYVHASDIVHRDLKPENILLVNRDQNNPQVKIVDFGVSAEQNYRTRQNQKAGTPIYMAPEQMTQKNYSKKVDLWACGIIQYQLLACGQHPLYTPGDLYYGRKLASIDEKPIDWQFPANFTPLAKDFFNNLCIYPPTKRYDTFTALQHPWITRKLGDRIPLSHDQTIALYEQERQLRKVMRLVYFAAHIKMMSNQNDNQVDQKQQSEFTAYKALLKEASTAQENQSILDPKTQLQLQLNYTLPENLDTASKKAQLTNTQKISPIAITCVRKKIVKSSNTNPSLPRSDKNRKLGTENKYLKVAEIASPRNRRRNLMIGISSPEKLHIVTSVDKNQTSRMHLGSQFDNADTMFLTRGIGLEMQNVQSSIEMETQYSTPYKHQFVEPAKPVANTQRILQENKSTSKLDIKNHLGQSTPVIHSHSLGGNFGRKIKLVSNFRSPRLNNRNINQNEYDVKQQATHAAKLLIQQTKRRLNAKQRMNPIITPATLIGQGDGRSMIMSSSEAPSYVSSSKSGIITSQFRKRFNINWLQMIQAEKTVAGSKMLQQHLNHDEPVLETEEEFKASAIFNSDYFQRQTNQVAIAESHHDSKIYHAGTTPSDARKNLSSARGNKHNLISLKKQSSRTSIDSNIQHKKLPLSQLLFSQKQQTGEQTTEDIIFKRKKSSSHQYQNTQVKISNNDLSHQGNVLQHSNRSGKNENDTYNPVQKRKLMQSDSQDAMLRGHNTKFSLPKPRFKQIDNNDQGVEKDQESQLRNEYYKTSKKHTQGTKSCKNSANFLTTPKNVKQHRHSLLASLDTNTSMSQQVGMKPLMSASNLNLASALILPTPRVLMIDSATQANQPQKMRLFKCDRPTSKKNQTGNPQRSSRLQKRTLSQQYEQQNSALARNKMKMIQKKLATTFKVQGVQLTNV